MGVGRWGSKHVYVLYAMDRVCSLRSSTTAKSARTRSCRPSAGPGLHQVTRGSAAHRRARRGHTTDHTPADRPGGYFCTARRRRRTSSASPFTSRASTS